MDPLAPHFYHLDVLCEKVEHGCSLQAYGNVADRFHKLETNISHEPSWADAHLRTIIDLQTMRNLAGRFTEVRDELIRDFGIYLFPNNLDTSDPDDEDTHIPQLIHQYLNRQAIHHSRVSMVPPIAAAAWQAKQMRRKTREPATREHFDATLKRTPRDVSTRILAFSQKVRELHAVSGTDQFEKLLQELKKKHGYAQERQEAMLATLGRLHQLYKALPTNMKIRSLTATERLPQLREQWHASINSLRRAFLASFQRIVGRPPVGAENERLLVHYVRVQHYAEQMQQQTATKGMWIG